MYFFSREITKAAIEAGLRGIIGEGLLDFPFVGRKGADDHLKYISDLIEQLKGDQLIKMAIAPHAIYSCSEKTLMKAYELAVSSDLLLHIHVSETEQEVYDALKNFGKRPVQYLAQMGFLDHKVVFAHGVWLDQEEIALMAEKHISNIICTESNLKLASGFAPVKDYVAEGVNLCLGTDGVSSNNDLDMFSEMDFTAKVHKALHSDSTILPAEEVLKMATINGAKALHLEDRIGSLEIGKLADIVILDTDNLISQPLYNVYSYLVYAAQSSFVKDVIINGKLIMQGRELLTLDEKRIKQEAAIKAANILS
jgi:5-methylthioadenosine/S-adenosylhomocysteine deaminase